MSMWNGDLPAEKASKSRLGSFLDKVGALGLTPSTPPDEVNEQVAYLAAAELKKMADSDQGKALAKWVKEAFTKVKGARLAYEREWLKNIDMTQGRQFTQWDTTRQRMVESPRPNYEPRIAVNIIESQVRTQLAKIGASHPTATVVPASNEDSDVMAAQAAEQLWDWHYDVSRYQVSVFNPANYWATVTGNAFIKTWYDETTEDPAATAAKQATADTAQQAIASTGLEAQFPDPATMAPAASTPVPPVMGKVRSRAISPFHIYVPDLTELDLQEQPFIIHAYPMNRERARTVYADFVDKDWTPTTESSDSIISSSLLGLQGGNTANPDTVIVVEMWVKPGINKNIPSGGVVVMIGDTIVGASEGMPYAHGDFPFAHLTGIETGVFYRRSFIVSMIPIQDDLNRMYSQAIKHRNLMQKPMMFYDQGSIDVKKIQSKAGTYIPVALGAARPTAVPVQEVPQTFWNLMDRLKQEADNISGQHDVSRSQSPGADTAASAIATLQESDNNFLYSMLNSVELVNSQTAKWTISNIVQFWDEPRMVKVVGDDGTYDVKELKGSDLRHGTDIRMEPGSGLPESKAARTALITEWMEKQFIPVTEGMKALEMGRLGKVFRILKIDEDQATRENIDMKSMDPLQLEQDQAAQAMGPMGDPATDADPFAAVDDPAVTPAGAGTPSTDPGADPTAPPMADPMAAAPAPEPAFPINSYDNDDIHVAIHQRFMKGQAYSNLDPAIKQVFEEHVAAHQARLSQAAAQQMQQQAMQAQGALAADRGGQGGAGYDGGQPAASPGAPAA